MNLKKTLASALVAGALITGVGGVKAEVADAKPAIDCTVLVFKPQNYWYKGWWSPRRLPTGMTMEEWYWNCKGRFKPKKKGPDLPQGSWGTTIHLNLNNCSYTADGLLKDYGWWKNAKIYVA